MNAVLVNGLILAMSPLLAVLMLDRLGYEPWQYAFAFAAPCVGGLIGSRLSGPLVTRYGQRTVLVAAGTLRACWCLPLAFVPAGPTGLVVVLTAQFGLVLCMGVYGPVLATHRLLLTPQERVARTLTAWSVSNSLAVAAITAAAGLLAATAGLRPALAACALLLLATPLLLRSPAARTGPPPRGNGAPPGTEPDDERPAPAETMPPATDLAAAALALPADGR